MKKSSLGLVVGALVLSLTAFQNCSSGSLPDAAKSNLSSSSVTLQQCKMDNISYISGTVQMGYGQATANGTSCPSPMSLTCTNGVWTGTNLSSDSSGLATSGNTSTLVSYTTAYANCTAVNQSCSVVGTTLASGSTLVAYTASSVPNGTACSSVQATLSCTNGSVTSSTGAAASTFVSTTCTVQPFAGNYKYVGQITTGSYQDPTVYGVPYCPTSSGGACSSKNAQCFVDYGGYYDGYNSFNLYSCK